MTFGEGTNNIPNTLFHGCQALTAIEIPATVKTIGENAFEDCSALASVKLNEGLEQIGYRAFIGTVIPEIYIPSTLTAASRPFENNTTLNKVTFGEGMNNIPNTLFLGCNALTAIEIPATVKTIGENAFAECGQLSSVKLNEGLEQISYRAFCGTAVEKIDLPSTVKTIGAGAFENCEKLTEVTAINSYEWKLIGSYAFENCTSLIAIFIPGSVTNIGNDAFSGCKDLVISGYDKTYAQKYAEDNSIPFSKLGIQPGDLNEDGSVNLKDVVLLRRYVAGGWDTGLTKELADINGDGNVNLKDVVLLRRYIAGGFHVIF